jgi:hypothetical protein
VTCGHATGKCNTDMWLLKTKCKNKEIKHKGNMHGYSKLLDIVDKIKLLFTNEIPVKRYYRSSKGK